MKNSTGDLHDGGENPDEHQMDDNEVFDNRTHSPLA
jgi:hypothetical protein